MSDKQADETERRRARRDELEAELLERREAALAQVVKFGDPVLKSKASPVREFGPELRAEVERMIAIMRDGMGVGLAATQLGVLRRLLVFQAGPDSEPTALVNPRGRVALRRGGRRRGGLPQPAAGLDGRRAAAARPLQRARRRRRAGRIEASGLEARVLQHELDHLDGVLILDRAPRAQRKGALRALREGGSYSPPLDEQDAGDEGEHREPRTDA